MKEFLNLLMLALILSLALQDACKAQSIPEEIQINKLGKSQTDVLISDPDLSIDTNIEEGLSSDQAELIDSLEHVHLEANEILMPNGQLLSDFIAENQDFFDKLHKEAAQREKANSVRKQ